MHRRGTNVNTKPGLVLVSPLLVIWLSPDSHMTRIPFLRRWPSTSQNFAIANGINVHLSLQISHTPALDHPKGCLIDYAQEAQEIARFAHLRRGFTRSNSSPAVWSSTDSRVDFPRPCRTPLQRRSIYRSASHNVPPDGLDFRAVAWL